MWYYLMARINREVPWHPAADCAGSAADYSESLRIKTLRHIISYADVAELADALVSGSSEAIHVGSSPVVRTKS